MAKIRIEHDIEKCWDCPKCISKLTPTPDSFEEAYDYYCGVNNNKIVVTINVDLKKYDATKLPENDKIKVVNTFNETSKSVKEKIAYSGDVLCE